MTGRLSEAVGIVAKGYPVRGNDGPLSFIGDCLYWIVHLIYTVFDSIVHFIAEVVESLWNCLGSGFQDALAGVWRHITDFATYVYEGIESGVERLVDACNGNSTCSSIARETKDFAVYLFEEFKDHIGLGSLVMFTAAAILLYIGWSSILGCLGWCYTNGIVRIVRCCGFRQTGIRAKTPASNYMASYGGYVPASSYCARYQSIGATGVVYDDYYPAFDDDVDNDAGSGCRGCCKNILLFAFAAIVLYYVLQWL